MLGRENDGGQWPFPKKEVLTGTHVRLEPLAMSHLSALWAVAANAPASFEYLRYGPFADLDELGALLSDLSSRDDQPFWAVIANDGKAQGWISICDVYPSDGAFEIGSIWFAPTLQGTRAAREAIFLLMKLGMDDLGYERLVWRCQAQNAKSFKAALNLGFTHEGTWRNAAVVNGWQRDIAWFSILKGEWPKCRRAFELWVSDENFDNQGVQLRKLEDIRAELN